jgi:hypothetical protein
MIVVPAPTSYIGRQVIANILVAFLLPSVPASAFGLHLNEPQVRTWSAVGPSSKEKNTCALELSNQSRNSPDQFTQETAFDSPKVDDRWASGATYQWNAGVNRAVDHLLMPPDQVQLRVTQTGDDLRGRYEGTKSNATFAAFEVVIH